MIFFAAFIIEIIILFVLSKKLIKSIFLILFKITNNHTTVVNIMAIIFLPGTIAHELAHLLTAGIMLVHVGEMKVLPEIEDDRVKLGSVQVGKTDPFRQTLIGVAPVIGGILTIIGILYFAQSANKFIWWQDLIGLYLIFEISNTMFSSKRDIEGTIGFIIGIIVAALLIIGLLYFIKPIILQNVWLWINKQNLVSVVKFFKLGSIYMLVPLLLDLIIIALTKPYRR